MLKWFIGASFVILSWPAGPATAQSVGFHGPALGFFYNHGSRTIQPLLGVPGAAHIGASLVNRVDFASIGPDATWAFVSKARHCYFLRGLPDLAPLDWPAEGLIDTVDRVQWSRNGSFALLYSSSANLLQRVRLSTTGVTADPPLDLSPWGPATALAIDPAGNQIAFGGAGSGLYLFAAGETPGRIAPMAQPAVAAFDGAGRLYAVDVEQQQIAEFDSGSGALPFASLVQPSLPSVMPVGMAVSGDGQYLLLADTAAHAVRAYETASGRLTDTIPLDFAPTRFEALSSAPTYLLNGDNNKEWLLILDARRTPGTSFVPANRENAR